MGRYATVVREPAYGAVTVRDVVVTAGVAMALGESGAPAVVVEGELKYVFPWWGVVKLNADDP